MSVPTHPDGAFAQRIANVLSIPYNEASIKHSLAVLEGTDVTEKTLLDSVEGTINIKVDRILSELKPFYRGIKSLEPQIASVKQNMDLVDQLVRQTRTKFSDVTRETLALEKEQHATDSKLATLDAFNELFVLSGRDAELLSDMQLPIDDEFYRIFEKGIQIQEHCTVILAESPDLGESLLGGAAHSLALGYQKVRAAIRAKLDDPENHKDLRQNLRLLQGDPFMFKEILGELCQVRQKALKREFVASKPQLELKYEAERAIGMECAWLHSAMINEYDLFRNLVGETESDDFKFSLFSAETPQDLIYELVDSIFQGVEPLFKQRVHLIISVQNKIIALDSIHNVVEFYGKILRQHHQHTMVGCFNEISQTLSGQFNHLLLNELEHARKYKKIVDLNTPDFIYSILRLLRQLLDNYQNSMNYEPLGDEYITTRINEILDPFIEQCYNLGAVSLNAYDKQIFSINCLDPIKMELTGHIFANSKIDQINARIEGHETNLVNLEYDLLLQESAITTLSGHELHRRLDQFVVETLFITGNRLRNVNSPSTVARITEAAYDKFLNKYGETVVDAPKSVDDLRVLLLR